MREILFRGKLKANGEWSFGCLKIEPNKNTAIITPDDTVLGKYGVVEPDTVGQFTGLYDKNNVKIFEGDIVRGKVGYCGSPNLHIKDIVFVVKYRNACFDELYSSDYYEFEIIGNIYDNPELVEE